MSGRAFLLRCSKRLLRLLFWFPFSLVPFFSLLSSSQDGGSENWWHVKSISTKKTGYVVPSLPFPSPSLRTRLGREYSEYSTNIMIFTLCECIYIPQIICVCGRAACAVFRLCADVTHTCARTHLRHRTSFNNNTTTTTTTRSNDKQQLRSSKHDLQRRFLGPSHLVPRCNQ